MPAKTKKSQLRILMEDHMLIIKMNKSFSVDFSLIVFGFSAIM